MGILRFETKEESNRRREEEFLTLSGEERLRSFFRMVGYYKRFPVKRGLIKEKENFIIWKKQG
jgi:hypothetical protein